jgi:AcrR family transcriptional regulator
VTAKRVTKNPDERRSELLETALRLFSERGYEDVAVQDITDALSVAKGTFYYYFASKADLLAQLIDWQGEALMEAVRHAHDRGPTDALSRFRAITGVRQSWKLSNDRLIGNLAPVLYREEHQLMRFRLLKAFHAKLLPLLSGIIEQGMSERTFAVADPAAAAQAILWLWEGAAESLAGEILSLDESSEAIERVLAMARASEQACERILGVADGTLGLYDYDLLRSWLPKLRQVLEAPNISSQVAGESMFPGVQSQGDSR